FDWLLPQLDGKPAGPKPTPRTMKAPAKGEAATGAAAASGQPSLSTAFGLALRGGLVVDGKAGYRKAPITVELRTKLDSKGGYNILVASDTKKSSAHWELFTMPKTGA